MGKAPDYIALAVPVFFLLIGLELLADRLKKTENYRFNDSLTNISCGIEQQILGVFIRTLLIFGYIWLYYNARFITFPIDVWWSWVILFLGVDFFYYWFHRYAHEISLFWGGHIVHHQSEEYNLTVALRQGAFQTFFSTLFYLPLAVLGFDPIMFIVVNQFQTLYQFWIHTKAIGKMPRWFEFIFNTPSHHRVHHGVNPKYIDRNHAGTLIIWDRMFGTFQEEEEEVVYGITKPVASWNPVWAQLDYFVDLFRLMRKCRNVSDVFKVLVKGPGWRPEYLGGPLTPGPVDAKTYQKYDTRTPNGLNYYIFTQYVITLAGASVFLNLSGSLLESRPWVWAAAIAGLIVVSVMNLGVMLEMKRWSVAAEFLRFGLLLTIIPAFFYGSEHFVLALGLSGGIALLSALWFGRYLPYFSGGKIPAKSG